MTRDDIIRLARDAGLTGLKESDILGNFGRFAALVAAVEREACAKVCEDEAKQYLGAVVIGALETSASIIRRRGEVKP